MTAYHEISPYFAKNAVDLDNVQSQVITNSERNSWLMYDFKNLKVRPTHYSIRSRPCGSNNFHLKSWVIEGSNDQNNWIVLDYRNNIDKLNNKSAFSTFKINEYYSKNDFYRFLRLRQTGPNTAGNHQLCLSSLEYFGSII